jgi:hypothetical protein
MTNYLWDDYEGHRKLHLANWHLVCIKKGYGGLGVPDLRGLNLCLLGFWVKRYIRDEGKIWRDIIEKNYCRDNNIFYSDKTHISPFWKGIILAAQALKIEYTWVIGSGEKVKFWEDTCR